ncbi:2533_t:CDS:2, partial [Gigaspora margarita]
MGKSENEVYSHVFGYIPLTCWIVVIIPFNESIKIFAGFIIICLAGGIAYYISSKSQEAEEDNQIADKELKLVPQIFGWTTAMFYYEENTVTELILYNDNAIKNKKELYSLLENINAIIDENIQIPNTKNIEHIAVKHVYEDKLHLSAIDDDKLARLLVDRAKNLDRSFVQNLYNQFRTIQLCNRNRKAGTLSLGIFLTSDEAKVTIKNAINLFKTILLANAFYECGPQLGPQAL